MLLNLHQLKIEYFKSSGPGGQHKNKRFTAVRITHLPTGISAIAAEQRSQAQNKEIALQRLQDKIARLTKKRKLRIPTKIPRAIKERILESKKRRSQAKELRRKLRHGDWDI
jgi:protein subunit release factor A